MPPSRPSHRWETRHPGHFRGYLSTPRACLHPYPLTQKAVTITAVFLRTPVLPASALGCASAGPASACTKLCRCAPCVGRFRVLGVWLFVPFVSVSGCGASFQRPLLGLSYCWPSTGTLFCLLEFSTSKPVAGRGTIRGSVRLHNKIRINDP